MNPKDAMLRAKAASFRALELDPESADAYTALGITQIAYDRDWVGAESNIRHASEPESEFGFSAPLLCGVVLWIAPKRRGNRSHSSRPSVRPSISPTNNFVGIVHFGARQYDQSIAASRKTLELEPRFGLTRAVLGAALEAKATWKKPRRSILFC
jgi:tetratricopeptide (TPR) repeat protein